VHDTVIFGMLRRVGESSGNVVPDLSDVPALKVFGNMRRGAVIKGGKAIPGPRKTRHDVPWESGVRIALWVDKEPGKCHVHRFTTELSYEEALGELEARQNASDEGKK